MNTPSLLQADDPLRFTHLSGRQILDSRGFPTVEVRGTLADGTTLVASTPSGASTGAHEAVELRDGGPDFSGRGVTKAVGFVNGEIADFLTTHDFTTLEDLDRSLADLDDTPGYQRLGANSVVAVSILATRAFAHLAGVPVHRWIAAHEQTSELLPVPHFNVLNGGAHAANALDFQEFMIAPVSARSEEQAVQTGADVYHALKSLVAKTYGNAGLGDEGGFAPPIDDPHQALDLLVEAIGQAGYTPGKDQVAIALDPAANSFHLGEGRYRIGEQELGTTEMVDYYLDLARSYPIRSIEDGFAEDDPDGWTAMGQAVAALPAAQRIQLVGDDLYVTDPQRIRDGAAHGWSDAALIKPNQIGTVSQTLEAIRTARELDMACMVSHRSGETADVFIADLVVGTGVGQIKSGAPARGERVAKYNRLMEIAADNPTLPFGLV
jgi:enolase